LSIKPSVEAENATITHDDFPTVQCDPSQIRQLFQNLIGNAIKFKGDNQPRVHVSAEPKGSEWQISVHDNGIGIAPQYFERIFIIFQRLHTREDYPGSGIGLAICKKIIERHGGRIWVESAGRGLDVLFHDPNLQKRCIIEGCTMNASGTPIEILLVEDNPADVRLTIEALKEGKVSNHLSVACDGVEALEFLRKNGKYSDVPRPDLILLDLNMPRKDGREVLEDIKTDPDLKRIPVVIMTTSKAEQDIIKSYNLHANCYVTKPIDLDQFIEVVKAVEDFWLTIVTLPSRMEVNE